MKICPKCNKPISYNSYFGAYICNNCGWEKSNKNKYECIGEECCHFYTEFNNCAFWLNYKSGFCDIESLKWNINRFCPLANDSVNKNETVKEIS